MRLAICATLLLTASLSHADSTFPPGYWDRAYSGGQFQAETVAVTLVVKDLVKAGAEADRRLTKVGAALTSMNANGNYYGYANQQGQPKTKNIVYSIEAGKADAAARSLFDIGELSQFSDQKPQQLATQLDEISKKLAQVDEELHKNEAALRTMPISVYFLNTQHERLVQARDAIQAGMKKAVINLILSEPALEKK